MKKAVRMNNKGFSLVELMIVVAIIGILATIAVPNFQRFQAKAKQTEARAALSAIFTAEKAFYAEWSTYYGVYADIGYAPEGKNNYHTATSNAGAGGVGLSGPPNGTYIAPPTTAAGATCVTSVGCTTLKLFPTAAATQATAPSTYSNKAPTQTQFMAAASSRLTDSGVTDSWTINENKQMLNTTPGI